MTDSQRKFCEHYQKTKDKTESAIAAGYSEKSAAATGSRLLREKKVQAYLMEIGLEKDRDIASNEEILSFLTSILRSDDESVAVRDKMRAAELLGKNLSLFSESGNSEVSPIIFYGEENISN